jgi:nucleoside-diphosphate-sugar epimerase
MTKISILGCGWLGLPLAKDLIEKGFSVKGSTTSVEKISVLEDSKIEPFLITLSPTLSNEEEEKTIEDFLDESKILIINIPPKLRKNNQEDFVGKIRTLIPFIEKSTVENVIFVSSTSVYGDSNASEIRLTEETKPQPDTEGGKQLLQTEHLLQSNTFFKTTVVRFGGLIGNDRHPVRFLSGRENIENPEAPINLIHQEDCIGIIEKIMETDCWNETFNAVAPFHPSRENYYTQKAIELDLVVPQFNHAISTVGKTIVSDKAEQKLQYKFIKTTL